MIDRGQIHEHMEVIDFNGVKIGKVDTVQGERFKLTKDASGDGQHHYVDMADIARVDEHVHLKKTRAALGIGAAGATAANASAARASEPGAPNRDRARLGAEPRRDHMLWWILGGLALLALILAISQCDRKEDRRGGRDSDNDVPAVVTPRVPGAPLVAGTLAHDLDRFMASKDGLPRTFTFDAVNFDSGTANLRGEDNADLDDIARVLAAYPKSRAAIVGYADAQGDSDFNRELGANRARAVVAALGSRGVPTDRLEARTGGEDNPEATNATSGGRLENRRTELVILKR